MNDYAALVVALALIYVFYNRWTNHVRIADLRENLRATLRELGEDVYEIGSRKDSRGVEVIELRNPTTRIVFTDFEFHEEFTAYRFFKDSERSGANVAYISRHTVGGGYARNIAWWRHNHLHGRLLYSVGDITRNATIHDLVDQIIRKVRGQITETNTATPG